MTLREYSAANAGDENVSRGCHVSKPSRADPSVLRRARSFSLSSVRSFQRASTLLTTWLEVNSPSNSEQFITRLTFHERHRLQPSSSAVSTNNSSRPRPWLIVAPPSLLSGIPYPNSNSTELKERMSYLKSTPASTSRPSGTPDAGQVLCTPLLARSPFTTYAHKAALVSRTGRPEPRLPRRQPVHR